MSQSHNRRLIIVILGALSTISPFAIDKLRLMPILRNYGIVLWEPQFLTYALAGAFALSGLLVYVASSPIVFMEVFHVSARQFGGIFDSYTLMPVALALAATTWTSLIILLAGRRHIPRLRYVEETDSNLLPP